jgi:hypothetical protein
LPINIDIFLSTTYTVYNFIYLLYPIRKSFVKELFGGLPGTAGLSEGPGGDSGGENFNTRGCIPQHISLAVRFPSSHRIKGIKKRARPPWGGAELFSRAIRPRGG